MIKDLTKGSPVKCILGFAVPMFIGTMFQQFYILTDSFIIGRFIGVIPLAAVGGTAAIHFLILGFILGVSTGFMIPVAQAYGSKNFERLRRFVTNSVWLSLIIGAITTLITVLFTEEFLRRMKTPPELFHDSYVYIVTLFAGLLTLMFYNLLSGYMRALGDSVTPLLILVFSSVFNILLDLLFILVFHMGVFGSALATVLSQLVSALLCFFILKKNYKILKMEKSDWKLRSFESVKLLAIGIPMGLQYSITAVGSTILQTAINEAGAVYVAALTVGSKVSLLFMQAYETLGVAIAAFCGQNLGAGKLYRIKKGVKDSVILSFLYSGFAFVAISLSGGFLALLFIDSAETEIFRYLKEYLFINTLFFSLVGLLIILRSAIQGLGYSLLAMIAGIMEMIARASIPLFFIGFMGKEAIYYGNGFAWILANLFLIPAYFIVMKRIDKLFSGGSKYIEYSKIRTKKYHRHRSDL